jgi:hypothetical protein
MIGLDLVYRRCYTRQHSRPLPTSRNCSTRRIDLDSKVSLRAGHDPAALHPNPMRLSSDETPTRRKRVHRDSTPVVKLQDPRQSDG